MVCLVGCNQVYGLDDTRVREPPGPDRDQDSIPDDDDNCADVANVDQADVDADDIGDACDGCTDCDPCAVGPSHDEDGDKVPDGCDNCPTVPNVGLANVDNDDLGDACDPDPTTQQHRRLFDGFGVIDASWGRIGVWEVVDDMAAPLDGPHPYGYRLTNPMPLISGNSHWRVEVQLEVPANANERDAIGAYLVDQQAQSEWACTIMWTAPTWELTNGPGTAISIAPGPLKMTLSSKRGGATTRYCAVTGNPEKQNPAFLETYPMGVELYATRLTRFAYVEIIDGLQ